MRIYRMTATFGKLEHETLTLQPGLNIIHAPNEWGKSTWCAFLAAMLYGLDTRAKTTKTALADKERYAPWSGVPMEGSMDICWNGRDITIQRRTRGRVPMGDFRAFETETGIPVPELTAANCGSVLLGVEQSVFRRSGFIRLSDLPVTADDNLRRRLNALVTTGDESGDGERLARELRELRNRCRYNKSGLIPQAQAQKQELEEKLRELESLEHHSRKLKRRLGEEKSWLRQLKNHQDALAYAEAEADMAKLAELRAERDKNLEEIARLEAECANLPSRETAEEKLRDIRMLQSRWNTVGQENRKLPAMPEAPRPPKPFENMSFTQAEEMLGDDLRRYELRQRSHPWLIWLLFGGALLVLAALAAVDYEWKALWLGAPGIVLLILSLLHRRKWKKEAAALAEKYGSADTDCWRLQLTQWEAAQKRHEQEILTHRARQSELDAEYARLELQRSSLCGQQTPEAVLEIWQQVIGKWEEYAAACRELERQERHLRTLEAIIKPAVPPEMPDDLTYSPEETARLIRESQQEQQRLLNRLGQYQGRMETLGEEKQLQKELAGVNTRLEKLENTYRALNLALETLNDARLELQRRFAPRITKRAQELLRQMTDGRYDRLVLGEDFSLQAGAEKEDTLHDAIWRSEGTVDQLYLALRLAVAEELMPKTPLVLDDALARFDEKRMEAAMNILRRQAETKQVILFSCQKREQNAGS